MSVLIFQQGTSPNSGTEQQVERQRVVLRPSYQGYLTLSDLVGNSTAIVAGETLGVKNTVEDRLVPTTDYDFRVDRAVKGTLKPGDIITIRQTGIEGKAIIAELAADPLLKEGEKIFAFLRYSEEHDVYVILGGPQGRFEIQNGFVNSMDKITPEADWVPVKVDSKNIDEFILSIREEMNKQ